MIFHPIKIVSNGGTSMARLEEIILSFVIEVTVALVRDHEVRLMGLQLSSNIFFPNISLHPSSWQELSVILISEFIRVLKEKVTLKHFQDRNSHVSATHTHFRVKVASVWSWFIPNNYSHSSSLIYLEESLFTHILLSFSSFQAWYKWQEVENWNGITF